MATADLPGVRMWYEEHGSGDPLLALHPGGAGVDSRALAPTVEALSKRYHVYTPEQRAHGRTPDVTGPITFELMAEDTVAFIERTIGRSVDVFGYSDGAIVGLVLALRRPDLVRTLVFVAGVFNRDGWAEGVLAGEPPSFLRESYGEVSPDGIEHYPIVVDKLKTMHARAPSLTTDQLGKISCRTLVMFGDDDEVRLEHAIAMYRSLPNAELAVVPGTSHGLLVEKPDVCNGLVTEFLTKDPIQTFAPIRRKARSFLA